MIMMEFNEDPFIEEIYQMKEIRVLIREKARFFKQRSKTTLKHNVNCCIHCKKSRQYLQ